MKLGKQAIVRIIYLFVIFADATASVGDTNEHAAVVGFAGYETISFRMYVFEMSTYCLGTA